MRSVLGPILSDQYDSETNRKGYVNMGTAENVGLSIRSGAFSLHPYTT